MKRFYVKIIFILSLVRKFQNFWSSYVSLDSNSEALKFQYLHQKQLTLFEVETTFVQNFDNKSYFLNSIWEVLEIDSLESITLTITRGFSNNYGLDNFSKYSTSGAHLAIITTTKSHQKEIWETVTNFLAAIISSNIGTIQFEEALIINLNKNADKENVKFLLSGYVSEQLICHDILSKVFKLLPCRAKTGYFPLINKKALINSKYISLSINVGKQYGNSQDNNYKYFKMKFNWIENVRLNFKEIFHVKNILSGNLAPFIKCPTIKEYRCYLSDESINSSSSLPFGFSISGCDTTSLMNITNYQLINGFFSDPQPSLKSYSFMEMSSSTENPTLIQSSQGFEVTNYGPKSEIITLILKIHYSFRPLLHTLKSQFLHLFSERTNSNTRKSNPELYDVIPQFEIIESDQINPVIFIKSVLDSNHTSSTKIELLKEFINVESIESGSENGILLKDFLFSNHSRLWIGPSYKLKFPISDISMPYNVISITSTILTLFYGPICRNFHK